MCGRGGKCNPLPEPTGTQDDSFEYQRTAAGAGALAEGGRAAARRCRRSEPAPASPPATADETAGEGSGPEARRAVTKRRHHAVWKEPWRWRPPGPLPGFVAESPEQRALREERSARAKVAQAKGRRLATICGRWQETGRVPDLRLSGKWLREAGFDLGQRFEVEVEAGKLTIRAV